MTDEKPTVWEAFTLVMGDVRAIEKGERNAQQGFQFRGIDTTMDAVGPVLRTHGVIIIPKPVSLQSETYASSKGTQMRNVTVEMQYTVYGPRGDSFVGGAYGEAADAGDKAVSKAQSVAYRTFLLQGLTIPTHQRDPDADSHERIAPDTRASKPKKDPVREVKDELLGLLKEIDVEPDEAVDKFSQLFQADLAETGDIKKVRALIKHYKELSGRS